MSSKKKKHPTKAGLKKAQENFRKLYKKQPSEKLVNIISENPEEKEEQEDKIAAAERQPRRSAEL